MPHSPIATAISSPSCVMPAKCLFKIAKAMAEELDPLWLTALLLRVLVAFGCYISLHSAGSVCTVTVLGRTDLTGCQGQSSG